MSVVVVLLQGKLVLCSSVGLDYASCLESVSISSHSVTLNKATDVGCFTVWGVAQIGVAWIVGVAYN